MTETTKQSSTPNYLLRRERERRAWSQQDLADKVGTTPLNVSRWERGITSPSPYFRQKLCEIFEKNVQELGLVAQVDGNLPATHPLISSEASSQATSPAESPDALWNVPYRRNPFFTGREDILLHLRDTLLTEQQPVALAQPQAISGLGGIGKTQTVIEYAYRYHENYRAVLWVRAESRDLLVSDFLLTASLLTLPERNEQDQNTIVQAVIRWLDTHEGWLLILDNADDIQAVSEFIPSARKGHVILTTRAYSTGTVAQRLEIEKMGLEEGALFLLRRVKRLKGNASLETVPEDMRGQAREIVKVVDGLPLALDQAGAYIEETGCSLTDYLKFYKTRQRRLLRMRGKDASGHPEPVATTWSLSFEKVEQANPAAAELLRLCAFLHPDEIPEAMIVAGASESGPTLRSVVEDELEWNEAIRELRRYSLLKRDAEKKVLNIHRLVQAVIRDGIGEETQREWAERTVRMVSRAFTAQQWLVTDTTTWPTYQLYLPHAQACAKLIEHWHILSPESARLLHQIGSYMYERGLFTDIEPLLQEAVRQREQLFGEDSLEVAESLSRLARLYYNQCKFDESETLFQRVLAIREKYLGPEHADIAESLNYLAELYNARGNNAQAEPVYRRAIKMRIRVLGAEHPLVAQCLNNLSWLYVEEGRYAEAEPLTQQALSICEKAYGPSHADVAYSLNCMAWLYFNQHRYIEAEPLLERSVKIYQDLYGLEHPTVAIGLVNLARIYQELSRYDAAEALYQQALEVQERLLGHGHADVAQILHNMGQLSYLQGQYERAESLYLEALAIAEKTMGPEHAYVAKYLSQTGVLYTAMGRYDEAQSVLDRSLALREKLSGPDHPDIATTLGHYAVLLRKTNRELEAAAVEERVQAIRAK